jgi:hypothetical protein
MDSEPQVCVPELCIAWIQRETSMKQSKRINEENKARELTKKKKQEN